MNEKPILYVGEKNVSSWSMRGWLAIVHKEVPFEERFISLREDKDRAQRRKASPTGRVPVLHHAGHVIPDSLAIIEYLDETFPAPKHPALWPADPGERANARWLAATMHSGFTKLRESMSFNLCFLPNPPAATTEAHADAAEILSFFEDALSKKKSPGPYLFGSFGAADIMYAPAIWRLAAFKVPVEKTPKAAAYMKSVLDHPAVRRWMDPARAMPPVSNY